MTHHRPELHRPEPHRIECAVNGGRSRPDSTAHSPGSAGVGWRRWGRRAWLVARLAAAVTVLARLAKGRDRAPALDPAPAATPLPGTVSVVIPARDEAGRIGPCLAAVTADPAVGEVVVVDDGSTDATAEVARAGGARVVEGAALPPGWAGKPWALQQGIEEATGDWVVCLDADTIPQPGLVAAVVGAAAGDGDDLLTIGARFVCETPGERLLHPAMLTTLVYRFGPPGVPMAPDRAMANGQCMVVPRRAFLDGGGMAPVRSSLVEDVALARHLARSGRRVRFLDGHRVLDVRMYRDAADTWRSWGRSLPLADLTPPARQAADLGVVWLTQALPLARLLARRGDRLDVALLTVRLSLLAALAPSYRRRGAAFWLSPLADVAAAARLTQAALRPERTWRGRTYERPRRPGRSAGR
jgi:dolichol-phosphate mannosyltransferase